MIIIKIFSFNQVDTFYMLHVGEKSRMKFQHCQDKEWIFPNTACNIVTKNLHFFSLITTYLWLINGDEFHVGKIQFWFFNTA